METAVESTIAKRQVMNVEQVKEYVDQITETFNTTNPELSDMKLLTEILDHLIRSNERSLSESDLIPHRFLIILRNFYLTLFQHHRDGRPFDDLSGLIFTNIPSLFLKLSSHSSTMNTTLLKELIFDEALLHEINSWLKKISIDRKYLDDPQIKSLDTIIRTIQRLERNHPDLNNEQLLSQFYETIVKCICSSIFIDVFLQSIREENEGVGQRFFLYTCTDYIYSHSTDEQQKQSLLDIRQSLLRRFTQWLMEQSTYFRLWNNRMVILVRQLCFLLTLSIQLNRSAIFDSETFTNFTQLIDSFVNILYSIVQSESSGTNKLGQSLIGTIIPNLYTMILSKQLEKYLKDKHITSLILKIAEIDNDEIQLNSFRILSAIVTEYEIKNVLNTNHLIQLFKRFLHKILDDSNQILRLNHLLRCFKNLIQYDSIKDELIKQDLLPFLLRCLTEKKFESLHSQQTLLEIFLALTFNEEARRQLKENLDQITSNLSSINSSVANHLLWKLNEEEQILRNPMNNEKVIQYDLMFSFASEDKEIALQIFNELLKENYRICFDPDETLECSMVDKARTIDQSETILILMSESYKRNSFCRCEASYVLDHQYHYIPLIVTANYRPDSWLSSFIQGKFYIDFVKLDFATALTKLKNEIQRQRKPLHVSEKHEPIEVLVPHISSHPPVMDHWTNEDVKAFITSKNLTPLLPMLSQMNGSLLRELALMCLANRESMFHTLKSELSTLNSTAPPLTLLVYLRFVNEMQNSLSAEKQMQTENSA